MNNCDEKPAKVINIVKIIITIKKGGLGLDIVKSTGGIEYATQNVCYKKKHWIFKCNVLIMSLEKALKTWLTT